MFYHVVLLTALDFYAKGICMLEVYVLYFAMILHRK